MKKMSMFFTAVVMMVMFAACGGEKCNEDQAKEDAPKVEAGTEAPKAEATASSSDVVAEFEKIAKQVEELAPKAKQGDMDAIKKYQEVMNQYSAFMQKNADAVSKLSESEVQKIQELTNKITAAMQ